MAKMKKKKSAKRQVKLVVTTFRLLCVDGKEKTEIAVKVWQRNAN